MSYDTWKLASPYEGMPTDDRAEDLVGTYLYIDGWHGTIESYYIDADEDEDGKHDFTMFVVKLEGLTHAEHLTGESVYEALADQAAHKGEE